MQLLLASVRQPVASAVLADACVLPESNAIAQRIALAGMELQEIVEDLLRAQVELSEGPLAGADDLLALVK